MSRKTQLQSLHLPSGGRVATSGGAAGESELVTNATAEVDPIVEGCLECNINTRNSNVLRNGLSCVRIGSKTNGRVDCNGALAEALNWTHATLNTQELSPGPHHRRARSRSFRS